jgi:hypothetical protein
VEFKNKMFANYITLCITSGITLVCLYLTELKNEVVKTVWHKLELKLINTFCKTTENGRE